MLLHKGRFIKATTKSFCFLIDTSCWKQLWSYLIIGCSYAAEARFFHGVCALRPQCYCSPILLLLASTPNQIAFLSTTQTTKTVSLTSPKVRPPPHLWRSLLAECVEKENSDEDFRARQTQRYDQGNIWTPSSHSKESCAIDFQWNGAADTSTESFYGSRSNPSLLSFFRSLPVHSFCPPPQPLHPNNSNDCPRQPRNPAAALWLAIQS